MNILYLYDILHSYIIYTDRKNIVIFSANYTRIIRDYYYEYYSNNNYKDRKLSIINIIVADTQFSLGAKKV